MSPQARACFLASAADPRRGLAPEELLECVARCGCLKYRAVASMGPGAMTDGFARNLLGRADEEQIVKGL